VLRYGKSDELTPLLMAMVEQSAAPLTAVETEFAVDSTGFGAPSTRTWFSAKHGREVTGRDWVKLHAMVGVRTHLVTAAKITNAVANDSPQLPELAETTARQFNVREISADKGYSSKANATAIEAVGATPFISFKSNAVQPREGTAWGRMYHYFAFKRDEYLDHYHQRSNVESTFMMIKAKFGDSLLTKTETAQTNEVLGKVIAHNICCLIQASYELGIEIDLKCSA
jgi:transposase